MANDEAVETAKDPVLAELVQIRTYMQIAVWCLGVLAVVAVLGVILALADSGTVETGF